MSKSLRPERTIIDLPIEDLTPNPRNARRHPKKQLRQLGNSIERFGFINPVYINDDGVILVGHGRVEAARLLGLKQVPTLTLSHLSPAEQRAYMLADNKLALNAGWDPELLAQELQELIDIDFNVDLTGFSLAEIDVILDDAREASPETRDAPEDAVPAPSDIVVTQRGDLWKLGEHYLLCGDARTCTSPAISSPRNAFRGTPASGAPPMARGTHLILTELGAEVPCYSKQISLILSSEFPAIFSALRSNEPEKDQRITGACGRDAALDRA